MAPNSDQADADGDGVGDPCDAGAAFSGTVSLSWDPVADPALGGYRIYFGTTAGDYTRFLDAGPVTGFTISGLQVCTTYHFAVKARTIDGRESATFSNQVSGWPRPDVLSVTPPTVSQGSQVDVAVAGWNFQPGATVAFAASDVTVSSVTASDCGELIVSISTATSAPSGPIDFEVVNPDQVFGAAIGLLLIGN
jgi:hypothetical protein